MTRHLDIEQKQIKGFLLHLQFAQKFPSVAFRSR